MSINEVIQNLIAKGSGTDVKAKSNELDAKLAELMENDPASFAKVMDSLETISEEDVSLLNGEELSEDLVSLNKQKSLAESPASKMMDQVSVKKSSLKILESKEPQTGGVQVLEPIDLEVDSSGEALDISNKSDVSKILDRRNSIQSAFERSANESNLSLEEISDIEKLLKTENKAQQNLEIKKDGDIIFDNKEVKNIILKNNQPKLQNTEEVKVLSENSDDFLELRKNIQMDKNSKPISSNVRNFKIVDDRSINFKDQTVKNEDLNMSALNQKPLVSNDAALMNIKTEATSALNGNSVNNKPVLNLESLGTSNREAIINKVSDYIIQSNAKNAPRVEMSFNHSELGQTQLLVEKSFGNNVNITISPSTTEGMKFFTQHQTSLVSTLSNSGINLGEFKLDGQSFSGNQSFDQGSQPGQEFAGNRGGSMNQREQDSKKRQDLWQYYQDREAA